VCSVLVDSKIFWIFVVMMLLNTKLSLIVTKQLVFYFAQKIMKYLNGVHV